MNEFCNVWWSMKQYKLKFFCVLIIMSIHRKFLLLFSFTSVAYVSYKKKCRFKFWHKWKYNVLLSDASN